MRRNLAPISETLSQVLLSPIPIRSIAPQGHCCEAGEIRVFNWGSTFQRWRKSAGNSFKEKKPGELSESFFTEVPPGLCLKALLGLPQRLPGFLRPHPRSKMLCKSMLRGPDLIQRCSHGRSIRRVASIQMPLVEPGKRECRSLLPRPQRTITSTLPTLQIRSADKRII